MLLKQGGKAPIHDEEPDKCRFIDDLHGCPGCNRDGMWSEYSLAQRIRDDTGDSRDAGGRCLSDIC